jgi:serine/threonine protein kinase
MIVEDITLMDKIGKGSFGEVYISKKKNTSQIFAAKKIAKSLAFNEKIKKYFNNEIYILKNISHPNIIKLYEIKQTINNFYLLFDYCNGGGLSNCLEQFMKKNNKPFTEEIVQYLLKKIVSGLYYLHKNKIIHRDLKLDNILVHFPDLQDRKDMNIVKAEIKIIDFGFARYLRDEDLAQSVLGSPINMAPQLLAKLKKIDHQETFGYDDKVDIWSLGTIAYELLVGAPPFTANTYDELMEKVNKGQYAIPKSLKLSKQCVSLLNGLLQHDPKARLGVDDVIYHEFLTLDPKLFEPISIKNYALEDNQKEYIISTKDNKNIWALVDSETPGNDLNKNSGRRDSKGTPIITDYNQNLEKNVKQENKIYYDLDTFGSLLAGIGDMNINNLQGIYIII